MPDQGGLPEESVEDRKAAKPGFYPASLGLSFLVPPAAQTLSITVRWGDYEHRPGGKAGDGDDPEPPVWQRRDRERTLDVPVSHGQDYDVPDSGDTLALHVVERAVETARLTGISAGTRAVSIFLVNRRPPDQARPNAAYAFQAELEVRCAEGFAARPDPRGVPADDWDAKVADLHYADAPEYASGHGVSADWEVEGGECRLIRTTWIPEAHVAKTETVAMPDVELSMDALGCLPDGRAARTALEPLVADYRRWIEVQGKNVATLSGTRRQTGEELLRRASEAAERIGRGIALLARDDEALDAFRVANRAVGHALRRRLGIDAPAWRASSWPSCCESRGARRSRASRTADRGLAVLPHRRWQDGGVSRPCGVRDGVAAASAPGP